MHYCWNFINFTAPKYTRRDTHKTQKPFFLNWKQKKNENFSDFFSKKFFWWRSQVSRKKLKVAPFEEFFWKNEIFELFHSAEICKRGTLWGFSTSIQLQNITKIEEGPFGDICKKWKEGSEKWKGPFCFVMLVKILAHTHQFEHETSGLKSKNLTTRPRTPELCDLPTEMRVVTWKKEPTLP